MEDYLSKINTIINLADELKNTANRVCYNKTTTAAASIAEVLIVEARQAAHEGRFFLHIWLKDRSWKRVEVEEAAVELRNKKLTVEVGNEIVAWHSNTDWDSEDFIKVSWK